MFLIVDSDHTEYAKDGREAAMAAGAKEWNWVQLANAANQLNVGDELEVTNDISIIRLSDVEVKFEGVL
jgi:hypothetical protein